MAGNRIESFARVWPLLEPGALLAGTDDERFKEAWSCARVDSFAAAAPPRVFRSVRADIVVTTDELLPRSIVAEASRAS